MNQAQRDEFAEQMREARRKVDRDHRLELAMPKIMLREPERAHEITALDMTQYSQEAAAAMNVYVDGDQLLLALRYERPATVRIDRKLLQFILQESQPKPRKPKSRRKNAPPPVPFTHSRAIDIPDTIAKA